MSLKLQNKQAAIYRIGEPIDFDVEVLARKNFDNLRFRFELRYADDVPVGTIPDLNMGEIREGTEHTYRMTFDTKQLTRGKYKVYIVLFERNEFGTCQDHDLILPAFYFEIQDGGEITWNTTQWGHVRFADIPFQCLN